MSNTPTKYVVLCDFGKTDSGEKAWGEYARVEATSSDAAIRNAIEPGAQSGNYVAVPLRSWQPLPVTIEEKPNVAIGKRS